MNVNLKRMILSEAIIRKFGTVSKCAEAMGISKQCLSIRLASGRCRIEKAVALADLLGVPLSEIVKEDDND